MQNKELYVYNTLSKKKEIFKPINATHVGMYVCGPTVYGAAHLGHARPAITFDLLFRLLKNLEYKVRYVRNITDVGHLENDADEGEDKIAKKARLEQVEPMEIVQQYTEEYHKNMRELNVLSPSIEPRASGHIIEQIDLIDKIFENGFAYEVNGSVYFDVEKYHAKYKNYGKLSGRILKDLMSNTRQLDRQQEKRKSVDFALWKKASPEHIMRWPSKWSDGFPGWHMECSAMSMKYLGETFDIHGGGMDLLFPHHECEIAQSTAALGKESVKYWIHNNMITINGQKMGKSLGNFITLDELFTGSHKALEKAHSPMTIRFFILQAQYRSTLDFSNEALQAAEKGMQRLINSINLIPKLRISDKTSINIEEFENKCYSAILDDLNSPILISHLFDGVRMINSIEAGKDSITKTDLDKFQNIINLFVYDILGLKSELNEGSSNDAYEKTVDLLLNIRMDAKANKDFATSDKIRDELNKLGFEIKDKKDGFDWTLKG